MNTRANRSGLALLLLLGLLSPAGLAQEPEEQPHFPSMDELMGAGPQQSSPEARMRELFGQVETHLNSIDELLSDAAAGDTSRLIDLQNAGIADLLNDSLKRGREAQENIREIIEIAKELGKQQPPSGPPGSGQGQDSPPKPGEGGSPLDRGPQSQSSEQTPEMGSPKPEGQSPDGNEPGGDKPEDNQPEGESDQPEGEDPNGTDPKNPDGDPDADGQNRDGQEKNGDATGDAARAAQQADGWGDLPSHVQDTFRSAGRSELPVRYRDWIDEYYRKLNRQSNP